MDKLYPHLNSILDVLKVCTRCKTVSRVGDCEPCIGPDGTEGTGLGCPVPDCGGIMVVDEILGRSV